MGFRNKVKETKVPAVQMTSTRHPQLLFVDILCNSKVLVFKNHSLILFKVEKPKISLEEFSTDFYPTTTHVIKKGAVRKIRRNFPFNERRSVRFFMRILTAKIKAGTF